MNKTNRDKKTKGKIYLLKWQETWDDEKKISNEKKVE